MAEGDRISVSEDKLYRALGDLELRLVKHLNEVLSRKADAVHVEALESRVSLLETSRVQRAHIEADVQKQENRIGALERESLDHKAVRRALKIAVGSVAVGVVSVIADILLIFNIIH